MADPARIKSEDALQRTSTDEEHLKSEESENPSATEKPANENLETSSQDQPKENKHVSFERHLHKLFKKEVIKDKVG